MACVMPKAASPMMLLLALLMVRFRLIMRPVITVCSFMNLATGESFAVCSGLANESSSEAAGSPSSSDRYRSEKLVRCHIELARVRVAGSECGSTDLSGLSSGNRSTPMSWAMALARRKASQPLRRFPTLPLD